MDSPGYLPTVLSSDFYGAFLTILVFRGLIGLHNIGIGCVLYESPLVTPFALLFVPKTARSLTVFCFYIFR